MSGAMIGPSILAIVIVVILLIVLVGTLAQIRDELKKLVTATQLSVAIANRNADISAKMAETIQRPQSVFIGGASQSH